MTGYPAQWFVLAFLTAPILAVILIVLAAAAAVDGVSKWRHRRAEKRRITEYLRQIAD